MNLFDASTPRQHAQTLLLLAALALSIAGNVLSIVWYGGKTTHYIPVTAAGEAGEAMSSRPGVFPTVIQTQVAQILVQTLGNVTPESLLPATQTVRPYLAPAAYVGLHAQAQAESATMRVADVSIMTTDVVLQEALPLRGGGAGAIRFKFHAVRRLFSYGVALEPHAVTVVVEVAPPPIGRGVSEPLRVTRVDWPPLRIKDGEIQDFTFTDELAHLTPHPTLRRGVTR